MIIWTVCFIYTSSFTSAQLGDVSLYELLYGDLTKLENFFVLPLNGSDNDTPEPEPPKRRPFGELLEKLESENEILHNHGGRLEIQDFNMANIELKNLTRRVRKEGMRYDYDEDDYYKKGVNERKKKLMLLMANIQFLIHTRYKVAIAVKVRDVVKNDKRYKLGYLFARLRRLLVAQRKMVASAKANSVSELHHRLYTLMRLYEKIARLDVDMRDTCNLIKIVYGTKANFDQLY